MAVARHPHLVEEARPVAMGRLVGADLRSNDRELERDADPRHRRLDEIAVGVREDGELPAARASALQRRAYLGERLPAGQGVGQRILLTTRRPELEHGLAHDLSIRALATRLQLGFDVVVALELVVGSYLAEDARELTTNPAVPVDQRSVAIERRPDLGHGASLVFEPLEDDRGVVTAEAEGV